MTEPDRNRKELPVFSLEWVKKIVLYAVAVWTAFLFLHFPASVGGTGLDDSWRRSLAVFLKTGEQAGTEWIHSYGPLGHFGTVMYDADLFYAGFVWELLTKIVWAICLFKLLEPASRTPLKILLFVLVALFLPWVHPEVHSLLFLTSLGLLLTKPSTNPSKWFLLLVTFLFAFFSHIKFVYLMFCAVVLLASEYQYRTRNPKSLFTPLPLYMLFFLGSWILMGQSIANLPEYLTGSVQTANGYVEAMAFAGPRVEVAVAIMLIFLLSVIIAVRFAGSSGLPSMVVCLAGLFLCWKHGFVRQLTHTIFFFSFTFFLSLILLADLQKAKERVKLRFHLLPITLMVCLIVSAGGIVTSHWARSGNNGHAVGPRMLMQFCYKRMKLNSVSLRDPARLKLYCEKKKNALQQNCKIPLIQSQVGQQTVDIFSYEQSLILLNEMNWRARPVFQSFHTFTPYLAAVNAEFLESSRAPDFVLYKLQTTDDRFPTLDDNQAIFGLLKWYSPQVAEKSFVLLKRTHDPALQKRASGQRIMRQRTLRFGEEVRIDDVRGRFQKLQLNVEDSLAGQIRKFLFRPPMLTLRIKTSVGGELDYRFIPSMGRRGMLINPMLLSTGDFVRLYGLRDRARVVSFMIFADERPDLWFKDEIGMALHNIARPTSVLLRDGTAEQLASIVDR